MVKIYPPAKIKKIANRRAAAAIGRPRRRRPRPLRRASRAPAPPSTTAAHSRSRSGEGKAGPPPSRRRRRHCCRLVPELRLPTAGRPRAAAPSLRPSARATDDSLPAAAVSRRHGAAGGRYSSGSSLCTPPRLVVVVAPRAAASRPPRGQRVADLTAPGPNLPLPRRRALAHCTRRRSPAAVAAACWATVEGRLEGGRPLASRWILLLAGLLLAR
uniref:Uncharacterized protein n=1 Tax=Leersia perrieri TaxID=77586 RepID=A0A0D9WE50_9ORYZ